MAIAGHRTTYGAPFRNVDKLDPGDRIELRMPYGRFTYRVERTKIVPPTELSVTDRVAHDRLVLSACHPLYSAAQRIIVFARLDASSRGEARSGADPIGRSRDRDDLCSHDGLAVEPRRHGRRFAQDESGGSTTARERIRDDTGYPHMATPCSGGC